MKQQENNKTFKRWEVYLLNKNEPHCFNCQKWECFCFYLMRCKQSQLILYCVKTDWKRIIKLVIDNASQEYNDIVS